MSLTSRSCLDNNRTLVKNCDSEGTARSSHFTFSQNVEIMNQEQDFVLQDNSTCVDNVGSKKTDGRANESAKLIKKHSDTLHSDGRVGDDFKQDRESADHLENESSVKDSKFLDEHCNHYPEIENDVPHGRRSSVTLENEWDKNYSKNSSSVLDISGYPESFYSGEESQISISASEKHSNENEVSINDMEAEYEEFVSADENAIGNQGITIIVDPREGEFSSTNVNVNCHEASGNPDGIPSQHQTYKPKLGKEAKGKTIIDHISSFENRDVTFRCLSNLYVHENVNGSEEVESPVPEFEAAFHNNEEKNTPSDSSSGCEKNYEGDNLLPLKNAQEIEVSNLNEEYPIPTNSAKDLVENVVERKHLKESKVSTEKVDTNEGKCAVLLFPKKNSISNEGINKIVDAREEECSSTSVNVKCNDTSDIAVGIPTHSQTNGPELDEESEERLIIDQSSTSVSCLLESDFEINSSSIDSQNMSYEKSHLLLELQSSSGNGLEITGPAKCNTLSVSSFSNSWQGSVAGDSRLKKIATSISSSWCMAKEFLSKSLGRKRGEMDHSDDELDEKVPEKKLKLGHSSSCTCSQSEFSNLPVRWKCHPKPVSVYDYKVKGRRPLTRMVKPSD